MEHGLKYIALYVQKHKAARAVGYKSPLVRGKPLGAPVFVRLVYSDSTWVQRIYRDEEGNSLSDTVIT